MTTYVVWLEKNLSKIFRVKKDGPDPQILRRRVHLHHTKSDPENQKDCDQFFREVAESVKDADEIYLIGHNQARAQFLGFLDVHGNGLAEKVVGSEGADHLSDEKILELSRKFFVTYDLFGRAAGE